VMALADGLALVFLSTLIARVVLGVLGGGL
jgi:hypothetical protein